MATRERVADLGHRHGRELVLGLCHECRSARLASGLSQASVARAAGMSAAQYGRLERSEIRDVRVDQLARVTAALGMKLVMRAYPIGDPIRDAGQLRVAGRFRAALGPGLRWSSEVPLPIPGDLRAWDGAVNGADDWIPVEIETRLADVQATQRKISLKCRDAGTDRVILVIADTATNRRALRAADGSLRTQFPLSGRLVMASLRAGFLPDRSGIVLA